MKSSSSTIAIFDFDKTLVTKDSFRIFAFLATKGSLFEKVLVALLSLLCWTGIISNANYKLLLIERFWIRLSTEDRHQLTTATINMLTGLLNHETHKALLKHIEVGDDVVVLSAAPEFYLVPFVRSLSGDVRVFGTRIMHTESGLRLTNIFHTRKADVAKVVIDQPPHKDKVVVYTDHIDDLPLLRLATNAVLVRPRRVLSKAVSKLNIPFQTLR